MQASPGTAARAGDRTTGLQPREAAWKEATVLLLISAVAVMVISLAGPTLPDMQRHFAGVPGADFLVPMTVSAPLISLALLAVFVGRLADAHGRKRLLLSAMFLYGLVGSAPLVLDSLYAIVASRVALGALEAALATVATLLIADYYGGNRRARVMALQATAASVAALVMTSLGGVIGELGWRAPYAVYLASLLMLLPMALVLWEPPSQARASGAGAEPAADAAWSGRQMAVVWLVSAACGLAFLVLPVNFGYLHDALGERSPSAIGWSYGLSSVGMVAGTLVFGWLMAPRLRIEHQLALVAGLAGAGFVIMRWADGYAALTAGGVVAGTSLGMMFPVVLTWTMRCMPAARMGMGIGATQSCMSLGMFISPPLVVGLDKLLGGRAVAVGAVGLALLALAVLALVWRPQRRERLPAPRPPMPSTERPARLSTDGQR